jgi:hypothetical protein
MLTKPDQIKLQRYGKKGIWHYRLRFTIHHPTGRVITMDTTRSSGTAIKNVARSIAWQDYLREAELTPDLHPRVAHKDRSPSIQRIVDLYQEEIIKVGTTQKSTARSNALKLLRVCKRAYPGRDPAKIKVSELTSDTVYAYRVSHYEDAGLDPTAGFDNLNLNYSINSELRQARSVFGREARRIYKKKNIDLPHNILDEFLKIRYLDEKDTSFHRIGEKADKQMMIDAGLADGDLSPFMNGQTLMEMSPNMTVAYELARFAGLRDKEILYFRRHWLEGPEPHPTTKIHRYFIRITYRDPRKDPGREEFRPKSKRMPNRRVPVSVERVQRWLNALEPADPYDYLIAPSQLPTQRLNLIARDTNQWVAQYIPDRKERLHELRKQYGSDIANETGSILAAANALGDSIEVAIKHYQDNLKEIPTL